MLTKITVKLPEDASVKTEQSRGRSGAIYLEQLYVNTDLKKEVSTGNPVPGEGNPGHGEGIPG